ncbi:MAG: tRNA pseudouridine(55) synthase TruB [Nitrospirae bacterium]|nr:tRNA pseudouridine(55) synthase TruB [Nitrospirota bacterium]
MPLHILWIPVYTGITEELELLVYNLMDLIIALNKPKDITSQDAVTKVKKILKIKKAGHTGTLDPMATGLLLVCINRATRLASYFCNLDKEYRAVMKLGETTDTQDAYGKIIAKSDKIEIGNTIIEECLISFKGNILQQPPMFSALKHEGQPLYKLARKGIEVDRKPREVSIYDIDLININFPYVTFRVVCSKGTYIRTLCDDIGKKLGVGAHLFELERTAIGSFRIANSLTIEELISLNINEPDGKGVYTMDKALSWMPAFKIDDATIKAVKHGNPIRILTLSDDYKKAEGIRIKSPDDEFLAVGSFSPERNTIKMDVVFACEKN